MTNGPFRHLVIITLSKFPKQIARFTIVVIVKQHFVKIFKVTYHILYVAEIITNLVLVSGNKDLLMFFLIQWWAHDAVILSAEWNATNNLIISGDEDGYVKVRILKYV